MNALRKATGLFVAVIFLLSAFAAVAAPYAAVVIDARDGKVLHARSADRRLHPASLTKMMTLYMTFEAVREGRLKLDQKVRVSRHAARQVPSKIGLRSGRRYTIRDLIRATAVKSANDAAVALAEALARSEADFAKLMTQRARRMGMKNTTFRNASGLTHPGQRSTARDMAVLGRALLYDFPQYYNLFSRKTTRAAGKTIYNTNRKLLAAYRGADGIKTGYTRAAGFNLVSSAERGSKRIIAVVFGGKSSASRNRRIAQLLDMGFARAPAKVRVTPTRTATVRISPAPLPRPSRGPSLLAQAGAGIGEALVPKAQASDLPIVLSANAPLKAPAPLRRPGAAAAPALAQNALPTPLPRPGAEVAAAAPAPLPLPRGDRWVVQLGVFAREETAIAELASAALGVDGLETAGRTIRRDELKGRDVFRAQLTGFDKGEARDVCAALKAKGQECLPLETGETF